MSAWLTTFIIALILIVLSVLGLGISYFLTGKPRISCKKCGKPEEDCKICKKPKK